MKKYILFSAVLLVFCFGRSFADKNSSPLVSAENLYLGSECKGNYVWGAAMNLAWNDLCEKILHEKLKLRTSDEKAQSMARKFNTGFFTRDDLDEASFYTKSGFGNKTAAEINKESREKFPGKSFDDLKINLGETEFIAYAYFLKEVEYAFQFKEWEVQFQDQAVKGFYAGTDEQKANILILKYVNDGQFVISIRLKEEDDELILAKGFNMENPSQILAELGTIRSSSIEKMSGHDVFQMPKLKLNYRRDYVELINQTLDNERYAGFIISQMFENIKFDLDHKGARVENEAVIAVQAGAMPMKSESFKRLVLDKPFWVILKRRARSHPYFILGVRNSEIMEKS